MGSGCGFRFQGWLNVCSKDNREQCASSAGEFILWLLYGACSPDLTPVTKVCEKRRG